MAEVQISFPAVSDQVLAAMDAVGEPFSAGFIGAAEEPPIIRVAAGLRRYAQHCPLWQYRGELLYPAAGPVLWELMDMTVYFRYWRLQGFGVDVLEEKRARAADDEQAGALDVIEQFWASYPLKDSLPSPAPFHDAGVIRQDCYTHAIPNYRRVLREGLGSYAARAEAGLAQALACGDEEERDFYRAMQIMLDTAQLLRDRYMRQVETAELDDERGKANRQRLLAALARVPWEPAAGFYEAMVAENFILYFDGSDNLGRFDQDLAPYYLADLAAGRTSREEALALTAELWENMELGWNVALGGTAPDGSEGSNEMTRVAIEAAQGRRRPNLTLRLRRDTPEPVWDAAIDCIATGNGLPALYCEENYMTAIRQADLGVTEADLPNFAFGGCTELMIHGKSNVGSLEAEFNLLQMLSLSLKEHLPEAATFEDFLDAYLDDLAEAVDHLCAGASAFQRHRALYHPQPIRSLLIDDCVDEGKEYAAGGARYNWSVINIIGIANVVDSLAAVREVIFETGEIGPAELLEVLEGDFVGHEAMRRRLERCPRFGNGNPRADELARRVSEFVFARLLEHSPWRGGRLLASCLMFVTYAQHGVYVAATPDGRSAGEPVADSAGAYQGRDVSGPTALLRSVAQLDQLKAPGTLVVNIRLARDHLLTRESREKTKALIRTYFDLGGMQLQVQVVDQAVLREALEHPEKHGDLLIRVGGYSEYWKNLTPELRESILLRTEH